LEQVDFIWLVSENPRFLYNSGSPYRYVLIGNDKIMVHPRPSSDTDMLEVNAVVIPDRYTLDTDKIKLRKSFQWAVAHRAVSEYWASRGDAASAKDHFMRYLGRLGIQEIYPPSHEYVPELKTQKDAVERTQNTP
jgi:hypothetical protein